MNGSLALSRALGDFEFKMNATLGPDDQIVTGTATKLIWQMAWRPQNGRHFCNGTHYPQHAS